MRIVVRETPIKITRGTALIGIVGFALIVVGTYDYVQQALAIENAMTIQSTIIDTSLSESRGRSIGYQIHVEHSYQYHGSEYSSTQVFPGLLQGTYESRATAEAVLAAYTPGETVTAYVDPSKPGRAFLRKTTTQIPIWLVSVGGLCLLLVTLNAVGDQSAGQNTSLRPASEVDLSRYDTLFGIDRDAIHYASTRLTVASLIAIPLVLILAVGLAFGRAEPEDGSSLDVAVTDPLGIMFLVAFLAALALIASLLVYTVWSFTEYRRLRERIPKPRPPSPFKHPTRLVTILFGNGDLDVYGNRIHRTGFAFVMAVFFAIVLLEALAF